MDKTKNDELADIKLPALDSAPNGTKTTPLFVFYNPLGGEIFEVGSNVAIYWKGGPNTPPPQHVNIYLVDIEAWAVSAVIVVNYSNSNSALGLYQWTIPLT